MTESVPAGGDLKSLLKNVEEADAAIVESLKHLSSLREFRNTLLPIARIPFELMEEIFLEVAPFARLVPEGLSMYSATPRYSILMAISGVCRHWRAVAMRSSRLWSHIDMASIREPALQRFLALSQTSPLTLVRQPADLLIFFEEAHRLQHVHGIQIASQHLTCRLRLLGGGARVVELPLLESIRIHDSDPPYLSGLHLYAPNLKSLICVDCPWATVRAWAVQADSMTTLRIGGISNPGAIGLTDWLDLLENLPSLEELFVKGHVHTPAHICEDAALSEHRVTLRNLKKLQQELGSTANDPWIEGFPSLLRHIDYPWDTRLIMDARRGFNWEHPTEPFVSGLHFTLSSLTAGRMPPHCKEPSDRHRYRQPPYQCAALVSSFTPSLGFSMVFLLTTGTDEFDMVSPLDAPLISLAIPVFSLSPTTITIATSLLSADFMHGITDLRLQYGTVHADLWARVGTSSLTAVSNLVIGVITTLAEFIQALEDSLAWATPDTFLPQLHSLSIEPMPDLHLLLQRLADAVVVRRRIGLGPRFVDTGSGQRDVDVVLAKVNARTETGLSGSQASADREDDLLPNPFDA